MPTPKFSDVFRHAADNLATSNYSEDHCSTYTCDRIVASFCILHGKTLWYNNAREILAFYPLSEITGSWDAFNEFPEGSKRQSARFLWLCMLAEIAESEGN